jgi:hypothetical protein
MVGLQEAIPIRESATALVGGGKRFVPTEADLCEIGHLARRVSFPAKSTIITESEPSSVSSKEAIFPDVDPHQSQSRESR